MSDFGKHHKIQSVFKRDKQGRFLLGQWSRPYLEYLADLQWGWTEKVDGTNIRIGIDGNGEYRVGGRCLGGCGVNKEHVPKGVADGTISTAVGNWGWS